MLGVYNKLKYIEKVMLRLCTRNYCPWKKNNWVFGIKYATQSESFWLKRKMRKQGKQQQIYSSFLVLDFEATCDRGRTIESQV
jgi:hypothetical protein